MKNSIKILSLVLMLTSMKAFANCDVNGIDMADGENQDAFVVLSEKPAHFINKAQWAKDVGSDMAKSFEYSSCKDAMEWRVIRAKNSTQTYVALVSVQDECDGGNSYGVIYYKNKIVGSVSDSYIDCK